MQFFSLHLKTASDSAVQTATGRSFHHLGAKNLDAWLSFTLRNGVFSLAVLAA